MAHPIWMLNYRNGEPPAEHMAAKINELVDAVNKLMTTVETQEKEIVALTKKTKETG